MRLLASLDLQITQLRLNNVDYPYLDTISRFPLRLLELVNFANKKFHFPHAFRRFPPLESFHINFASLSLTYVKEIGKLKELRMLIISNAVKLKAVAFDHLANLDKLVVFVSSGLYAPVFSDKFVEAHKNRLEVLELSNALDHQNYDDSVLERIAAFKRLRVLNLAGNQILKMEELANVSSLRFLCLRGAKISQEQFDLWLKALEQTRCSLTHLDMGGTFVDNACIAAIAKVCHDLEWLAIGGTNVTSLLHLRPLIRLQFINAEYLTIEDTEEDITELVETDLKNLKELIVTGKPFTEDLLGKLQPKETRRDKVNAEFRLRLL